MPGFYGGNGNGGRSGPTASLKVGASASVPSFQKTKSISYGTSDEILSLVSSAAVDAPSGGMPSAIELKNDGGLPLIIMVGYKTYSTETAIADSGATRYLHTMLMPGEVYYPSIRAVISTATATTQFDGTIATNAAPDSNEYTDSGENCTGLNNTTDPVTLATTGAMFRVADLIRVENEVMEVTAISGGDVTVKRAMFGSSAASHADASDIRFPFFNAYHDFDKYSVAQTDDNGRFKCFNFFGQGRSTTVPQGLIPGSLAIKFYNAGYQELGLSGITSSTNSGLVAGGSYWLKIAIDGGTAESINFTADSSNVNFGGNNGVLSKIQAVLDEKYYNTASNTFEQKATVGIVGGDIRFTSGTRLSTSAIALTAGADGASAAYNIFAQQNGRFKALANIDAAVAARLPDDVLYDRITYATFPNTRIFCYDNGFGQLSGMCGGTINYETGAIDMTGAPPNAEFVYSVSHTSAFSGKLTDASTARGGVLVNILANCPSQKWNGSITVKSWE